MALFNLDSAVGRGSVGCDAVRWQGAATQWADAHQEKQRSQGAATWLNRLRSALTRGVKAGGQGNLNGHGASEAGGERSTAESRFKLAIASLSRAAALSVVLLGVQFAAAAPVVYDFEVFNDAQALSSQIGGISFGQATVLAAGVGLNEFEFPPHSGSRVVLDDGGPLSISFAVPVFSVGGFFNYATALNFSAYDSGNHLLGSLASLFASNLALSGDLGSSSNEFLSFDSTAGLISKVVISGDPLGGSFTLDDLTVDAGLSVPEPQSLALVLAAFGAAGLQQRRHQKKLAAAAGLSV